MGYTIIGVATGQRLEGGTRIIETVEAIALTTPNNVNFAVTVDKKPGWKEAIAAAAAAEAAELESVFDL